MVIAKFLSSIELGELKIIQSFIGVATIIGVFGFDSGILKMCSEKISLEEKAALFRENFKRAILTTSVVILCMAIISGMKLFSPDERVNKWMFVFLISIPPLVLNAIIMGYLQALKEFKRISKIQVIVRIVCAIVQITGTIKYGFAGFAVTTLIMSFVPLMILLYCVKNVFRLQSVHFPKAVLRRMFFYSKWSFADNAIGAISSYGDMFLLNYLILDRAELGSYGLSTIFLTGLTFITATAQSMTTPYFSERSNNKKEFVRVIVKYEKLMILLTLSISLFALAVVPLFIHIVYGNKYGNAGIYFQILDMKFLFAGCVSLLGTARLGLGLVRTNFLLSAFMLLNSMVCTFVGIKFFGVFGAAIGQTTAAFIGIGVVSFATIKGIRNHFSLQTNLPAR
jgi:O-antigen/teichoic acid export membrane protein